MQPIKQITLLLVLLVQVFVLGADGTVKNPARVNKIIEQARAQIDAANGHPIRWEVSTELGAEGIQDLFATNNINIEVVYVAQQTII